MTDKQPIESHKKLTESTLINFVLSHSYLMYFFAILFGMIFDVVFPTFISFKPFSFMGVWLMLLGSLLAYWAQSTSNCTKKEVENGAERDFARGPYKYSRNPTHIGLSLATLGYGVISGSLFIIIFMLIAFFLTKFIFLKKEEALLEQKYGRKYCEYKKKVHTWI